MGYIKTKKQEMELRQQQFKSLIETGLSIREIQSEMGISYHLVRGEYHKYLLEGGTRVVQGTPKKLIPEGCSKEKGLSSYIKTKETEIEFRELRFLGLIEAGLSLKEIQYKMGISYDIARREYHKYLNEGGKKILKGTHKKFIPEGCLKEVELRQQLFTSLIESGLSFKEIQSAMNISYSVARSDYQRHLNNGGKRITKIKKDPEQKKEANRKYRMASYWRHKGDKQKVIMGSN
jgi:transposase